MAHHDVRQANMKKPRTHYDNLKVAQNAPIEVIKAAYRSLALKYHPDQNGGNPENERIMRILNHSHSVLSDPLSRAEHDRWIAEIENGSVSAATNETNDVGTYSQRSNSGATLLLVSFIIFGVAVFSSTVVKRVIGTGLFYAGASTIMVCWAMIVLCGFSFSVWRGFRNLLFPILGYKDAASRYPILIWLMIAGLVTVFSGSILRDH